MINGGSNSPEASLICFPVFCSSPACTAWIIESCSMMLCSLHCRDDSLPDEGLASGTNGRGGHVKVLAGNKLPAACDLEDLLLLAGMHLEAGVAVQGAVRCEGRNRRTSQLLAGGLHADGCVTFCVCHFVFPFSYLQTEKKTLSTRSCIRLHLFCFLKTRSARRWRSLFQWLSSCLALVCVNPLEGSQAASPQAFRLASRSSGPTLSLRFVTGCSDTERQPWLCPLQWWTTSHPSAAPPPSTCPTLSSRSSSRVLQRGREVQQGGGASPAFLLTPQMAR
jgi:hypothetical protein